MNNKPYIIIIAAAIVNLACAQDSLFHIFSATTPRSTTSQALAGAGTAMPQDGFGGLLNPALTAASLPSKSGGIFAAGYWKDPTFDRLALPIGALFRDPGGAMGIFYRYLEGERGRAHDAVVNFAGRMFDQIDQQGPVEFGMNFRYEHSVWRREYEAAASNGGGDGQDAESGDNADTETRTADFRGRNILTDIGFYQTNILPGLDFSFVVHNLTGYRWNDIDGADATRGWISGRFRTMTVGALYTLPVFGGLTLKIPVDVEMANLFTKSAGNRYVLRAGMEARIIDMYSVRFGYAHAPEDPLDLITDFDYKNLFFGGAGIAVKPVIVDFFIGLDVFGLTATYYY